MSVASTATLNTYPTVIEITEIDLSQIEVDKEKRVSFQESLYSAGSESGRRSVVIDWEVDDKECPYNWTRLKRYTIAVLLTVSTFVVAYGSSVYEGAIDGIMKSFEVSTTIAVLGLSLYVLGFALGPLIWAPFSEVVGRRPIFIISAIIHIAFILGTSLAPNITCLLISRFLIGFGGASSINNNAAARHPIPVPHQSNNLAKD